MTSVTFERRNSSIDIPLLDSSSGSPLIARDIGKPNLKLTTNGRMDPRSADFWSSLENYQIFGQFTESDAYEKAINLAEMVKAGSGESGSLSIPLDGYPDSVPVQPLAEQEQALQLTYPPGRRDWVEAQLGLTRVSTTAGNGQAVETPTDSGSGPITLSDGSNSVELTIDIEVQRTVGRPNSTVRRSRNNHPFYIEKRKSAYDSFELSLEFQENTASKTETLISMFNQPLRRTDLTLDFNGIYGYGAFDVVPDGSNALRQIEPAAQTGVELIPSINLRVVDND